MYRVLKYKAKYLRNRILTFFYNQSDSKAKTAFEQLTLQPNKIPVISITFENPSVTKWQIEQILKYCDDIQLLIFDNSKKNTLAQEIETHCANLGIFYCRLPPNKVKHPNRSHAMAMNWIYTQFIQLKQPDFFGFIDHDLIPLRPFSLKPHLSHKPFYGLLYGGGQETWQVWAGYCFFDRQFMQGKKIDFMHHFQIGLDTGGFNYESLYKPTELKPQDYALNELVTLALACGVSDIQVIEDVWFHIGGIGYGNNFVNKRVYVEEIMALSTRQDNVISANKIKSVKIPANVLYHGTII